MVPDMTNDWSPNDHRLPLSADSAFVVHLMANGADAPEIVRGRIEHISSGQWTRFTSVAELIGFMRQTLAIVGIFALLFAAAPRAWDPPTMTAASPAPRGDREGRSLL